MCSPLSSLKISSHRKFFISRYFRNSPNFISYLETIAFTESTIFLSFTLPSSCLYSDTFGIIIRWYLCTTESPNRELIAGLHQILEWQDRGNLKHDTFDNFIRSFICNWFFNYIFVFNSWKSFIYNTFIRIYF